MGDGVGVTVGVAVAVAVSDGVAVGDGVEVTVPPRKNPFGQYFLLRLDAATGP
ncbi:hypothetical protein [Arthrobacter humicola]|uniref:hypothetical protein n=1 Tax=Arthrobacter humicola TaxID=409291 RepID=UPI001FAD1216|nr:hypothetical protein [Arthrobacter humicola]